MKPTRPPAVPLTEDGQDLCFRILKSKDCGEVRGPLPPDSRAPGSFPERSFSIDPPPDRSAMTRLRHLSPE